MKRVHFLGIESRSWRWLAVSLGGLLLLVLSLDLIIGTSERSAAANTVIWTSVTTPTSSGTYHSVAFGDVNRDGHMDLIAGSDGGVQAWAGNGAGVWTPLASPATAGTYYGLALGDLNNDGNLDIVAAEDGTGIHTWTGNGAGTLWTTMASPATTVRVWGLALGDINHDGKLDIAAGSAEGGGLRVWRGNGAGGWSGASTGLPGSGNYYGLAFGDLNNNGTLDLVAASNGDGVRAWMGDGAGTWTSAATGLPATGSYYGIALGDLDNDGDPDIAATNGGNGVRAWTGNGIGTWTAASTGLPGSGSYWGLALGDVNNDGKLDIAASKAGGVQVWTGDGGGGWSEVSAGLPSVGGYAGLALADLNDDGMLDIAAAENLGGGIGAWVDTGTPEPRGDWTAITSPTTTGNYQGLDVGDLNHDGKLDVVAASDGSGIQLWTGDGGNTWDEIAPWTNPDLPTTGSYGGVAFGDLDHDGFLDVVAGNTGGGGIGAWRFWNVGWHDFSSELPESGTFYGVALGDLDNDGDLDIVAGSEGLGVRAWTNGGGGVWSNAFTGLPSNGTYPCVAFGDLNHDGSLDIVAGSGAAGLGVWQGDGTGSWTARTGPTTSGTWQGVAVGDLNDDGKLDLVGAGYGDGVRAWAGNGAFGWTPLASPATSGKYYSVSLGDLNNDAKLDVAAGSGGDLGLEVWTGNGGTTWTPLSTNLPTSGVYPGVALGEIDNDGFLDLVATKYGGGSVHAWTGAEGTPPSGWTGFSPTGWISTTHPLTATIQVRDTGSGLNPNSAEYSYLGVAGVWSGWTPAQCSGTEGTTTTQTIAATGVIFGQDSGPLHNLNQIKFRVSDVAGNTGYSDAYVVRLDTTPPGNPTTFPDSSHWPGGGWEDNNVVWVDWDGASDGTSGVAGYSYVFSTTYELPDPVHMTFASQATSSPLPDGEWYIYVRTHDAAGNWAAAAAYDGPYRIDTGPPTNPTGFSSSHDVGVWSSDDTIYINWWGAADGGGGVRGYSFSWTESPHTPPDATLRTTETFTTSSPLDDSDSWYFHIRTVDFAGNWTADAAHWGPFLIDTTPPTSTATSLATVYAPVFTVNWSGGDGTGSGVVSYTVQVRDGAGGTWTDWLVDTPSTSAAFAGSIGHTYYFRTRATDALGHVELASEVPAEGDTSTAIVVDLEATGLEVTQAIQNLANEMPLVQDKETYVRVYLRSDWTDVLNVDARLYGTRDGHALPGSPLSPAGGRIRARTTGGDRGNLDHAFYFELPPTWRSGTVLLEAYVDPGDEFPEDNETNNYTWERVTFHYVWPVQLRMWRAHMIPDTYSIDDPGFPDIIEAFRRMWPIDEVDIVRGGTIWPHWHHMAPCGSHPAEWHIESGLSDDWDWILTQMGWTAWLDGAWGAYAGLSSRHWYAMVDPGPTDARTGGIGTCIPPTCIAGVCYPGIDGSEAAGVMSPLAGRAAWMEPRGSWTLAHELLHNRTRQHANCTGTEAAGGALDPDWPYDTGCQIAEDDPASHYGFFMPVGITTPGVITPTEAAALMSYAGTRWISAYNYEFLVDDFTAASRASSSVLRLETAAAVDEYLAVSGIVTPSLGTASLTLAYHITDNNPAALIAARQGRVAQADGLNLVLEGAAGQVLYTHPLSLSQSYHDDALTRFFLQLLPYDPGTARIVLKQGNTELAEQVVSAHAPEVTILSPNGGEVFDDTMTITWSGFDADGDDLFYSLQYSSDNGQTWQAVIVNWRETSLSLDTLNDLPGSGQALVRVIATDGINTSTDQSDAVFSVARHTPHAYIIEPPSDRVFDTGETVKLYGYGLDTEDGTLSAGSLTWASDRSGSLGGGRELWVSDLMTGTHRITLTATDSDGATGTDEITLFVGVSPSRIYQPIIVNKHP